MWLLWLVWRYWDPLHLALLPTNKNVCVPCEQRQWGCPRILLEAPNKNQALLVSKKYILGTLLEALLVCKNNLCCPKGGLSGPLLKSTYWGSSVGLIEALCQYWKRFRSHLGGLLQILNQGLTWYSQLTSSQWSNIVWKNGINFLTRFGDLFQYVTNNNKAI